MEAPMQKLNDLNQSRIVLKQDSTLIAVIEMSLSSWLVAGIVPGVERQPLKKLAVDESALLIPTTKDEDAKRPRAPEPRRRANSDCQPNESSVDPAAHPDFNPKLK